MYILPTLRHHRSAAFTLIELLTVIAIIGILAAIIIPTVGTVREKAQRAVDANNLREIVKAAQIYAGDNNDRLPDPQSIPATTLSATSPVYLWAGILAKNNILSDPSFYFAKSDPLYPATLPSVILQAGSAARNQVDADFGAATLSWEFVGGVKMGDPASTPVAYTRGLQPNGTWNGTAGSTTIGVYKDSGGYVAFLGGNVNYYPKTSGVFTSNGAGASKPDNILQAIPYSDLAVNNARIYGVNAVIGSATGSAAVQGP